MTGVDDLQPEIVALGEPMLEFNAAAGEGTFRPGHGGDTSNCAIAAARQDARAGYLTALGQDPFGESFLVLWEREGVDASRVIRRAEAPTGVYFVTHGPAGHAFSYYRSGSAASLLKPEELPLDYIAGARVLHVSGVSQAISTSACDAVYHAIAAAKAAGVLVSYDPNLRLRLWPLPRARAVIHAALAEADIALPGLEDARLLTGLEDPEAIAEFYLALGPKIVALTLGAEGCLLATPDRRQRFPALPLAPLDATAAGDTFDGAFLAEYLATGDPFRAAAYANAAAGLSTLGYGAVEPIPRRREVERALAGLTG